MSDLAAQVQSKGKSKQAKQRVQREPLFLKNQLEKIENKKQKEREQKNNMQADPSGGAGQKEATRDSRLQPDQNQMYPPQLILNDQVLTRGGHQRQGLQPHQQLSGTNHAILIGQPGPH